ncbi:RraA family protein [Marinomonas colpomeniae]|uniref:Putative 4-hydroxy-4-methyl-2-oxoglutarate aldolase n=1 Tax=Marinomonas colpomeniae TaxID=2774408 RepID=A0ABR8NU65_9GAMM|nr:RraA family protein [Marinomonas colpomeniae]MBD5769574.1 RraA family protein [Marinomonas colpomeniae]
MSTENIIALKEQFKKIPTTIISDALGRNTGINGLKKYHQKSLKLVGRALTIKCSPGDNLYIYKALKQIKRGDILVIDGRGAIDNALMGELIMLQGLKNGCDGFVIDGAIRDVEAFEEVPVYARNNTHFGPFKNGPGEIGVPVSIGGHIVMNGDIIVADDDGVVSFPVADAEEVVKASLVLLEKEDGIIEQITTGKMDWVDQILDKAGI